MIYVDRGDPAAPDFTKPGFTIDGAWHDLDLSGIVPAAGANMLVHLSLDVMPGTIGKYIRLREKGNSNSYNIGGLAGIYGHRDYLRSDVWVKMDANRVIQYQVESVPLDWDSMEVTVRGWMEPC